MNKQVEINKLINIAMQIQKNGKTIHGIVKSMDLFKGNNVNPIIVTGLNYLEYRTKENLPYVRRYMYYTYTYLSEMRNSIAEYIKDKELIQINKDLIKINEELSKNRDEELRKKRDKYLRKIANLELNGIYFPVINETGFNLSKKFYFDDNNIEFKFHTKLIHNIIYLIPNNIRQKDFFDIQIDWLYETNDISVMGLYNSIQTNVIEYIDNEKINYCDPLKTYPLYIDVFRGEQDTKNTMVSLCLSYIAFDLLSDKYLNAIYGGNIESCNQDFELALLQIAMLHISNWCTSFAKENHLLRSLSLDKLPYKLISKDDGIYLNNKLFVKNTEYSKFKILKFIHDNTFDHMIKYDQVSEIGLEKKCLQKHVNELNKKFADITCCNDKILVPIKGKGYKLKYRFLDDIED